ncbi:MAG: hypothetical protein QXY39_02205 [Thermofilaceae archaeon]
MKEGLLAVLTALALGCAAQHAGRPGPAEQVVGGSARPQPQAVLEAFGEYLQTVSAMKRERFAVVPDQAVREALRLPEHVKVLTLSGGRDVVVMAYEPGPFSECGGLSRVLNARTYPFLVSPMKMREVYLLHRLEPLEIGGVVFTFEPTGGGRIRAYFLVGSDLYESVELNSAGGDVLCVEGCGRVITVEDGSRLKGDRRTP